MARKGIATQQRGVNAQQVTPGGKFGLPGRTRWTEQLDVNDNTSTVLSSSAPTPLTGQIPFKQTDIVFGWRLFETHTQAVTVGTDVVQTSKYYPYNIGQQFQLDITNLYKLVDVQSMVDLAIFNAYRPPWGSNRRGKNANQTAPQNFPYNPATNAVSATGYSTASTSLLLEYDIPASIWLDEYVDIDINANYLGTAYRVPVSPLYMSGTAREVTPQETYAVLTGASTDTAPFVRTTVGNGTYADTVNRRWQRVGLYGTRDIEEMPQVFNWRYAISSKRFPCNGLSQIDIPIKQIVPNGGGGQLLSIGFRFFDPLAGTGGSGLPISTTTANFTQGRLLYGSSLIRFQDTVAMMQNRLFDQHDWEPPDGLWLWDMGVDNDERTTNALALNLYTTDVIAHFDLGVTFSTAAYVVCLAEVLTYVEDQPILR